MRCWHLVGRPGLLGAPHGCPIPRLAALGLDADLGFSRILGGSEDPMVKTKSGALNPRALTPRSWAGLSVGHLQALRSSAFWVRDFKGPFRTGAVGGRLKTEMKNQQEKPAEKQEEGGKQHKEKPKTAMEKPSFLRGQWKGT